MTGDCLCSICTPRRICAVPTGSDIRYLMSDPYLPEVTSGTTGSEIRAYRMSDPPTTSVTYSMNTPRERCRVQARDGAQRSTRTQTRGHAMTDPAERSIGDVIVPDEAFRHMTRLAEVTGAPIQELACIAIVMGLAAMEVASNPDSPHTNLMMN